MFGKVELALDGAEFARGAFLRHDVNAGVDGGTFLRPFVPLPDIGAAVGEIRVEFEVTADQPFDAVAEVAVVEFLIAELSKDVVNREVAHECCVSYRKRRWSAS